MFSPLRSQKNFPTFVTIPHPRVSIPVNNPQRATLQHPLSNSLHHGASTRGTHAGRRG